MHTPASTLPAAVLWDLDGTVVDTEPYWMEAERSFLADHGRPWSHELGLERVGLTLLDSAVLLARQADSTMSPPDIVARLAQTVDARLRERVPFRPGAESLLAELGALGVPMALVTMSYGSQVELVLAALPQGTFAAVVTGEDVVDGKPHPEPYLRGLSLLGVAGRAGECVALEDSPTGTASAVAAGIPTLVTPAVVAVPPGPGYTVIPGLAGVRAGDLAALARGELDQQPALR